MNDKQIRVIYCDKGSKNNGLNFGMTGFADKVEGVLYTFRADGDFITYNVTVDQLYFPQN